MAEERPTLGAAQSCETLVSEAGGGELLKSGISSHPYI